MSGKYHLVAAVLIAAHVAAAQVTVPARQPAWSTAQNTLLRSDSDGAIGSGDLPLTLREAADIALSRNPQRKLALAQGDLARAQAKLARTAFFPTLQFDETVERGNDPVYVFGSRLRQHQFTQQNFALNNLNRPTPVGNFVTQFSGSWTLFDSWQTQRQVRKADLLEKSAQAALTRSDQETIYSTVRAYELVLFALRQADVAQHAVTTAEALLKSSSDRVNAGLAVDADRIAATAYLAERRQEQIDAAGNVSIAWAELETALGTEIPQPRRNLLPLRKTAVNLPALQELIPEALRSRPDRASLKLQQYAAAASVAASKSAFGPRISSFGSWETDRATFAGSGGNNWVAGAELKLDLLPFRQRHELEIARAQQKHSEAAADAADQKIRLEVTRSFYRLAAARESLTVAKASAEQTGEGLRIATNRYDAGLATITDLLRTEDLQRQSETNLWHAVFANALAYADLRFAVGTLNTDGLGDLQ